jgi:hypothetical protein
MGFERDDLRRALDRYVRDRLTAEGLLAADETKRRAGDKMTPDLFEALDRYIESSVAESIRRSQSRGERS